ncbi:MAG: thioesterase family protein [Deltaproteobacteria bacterium]|nr:MAG: thioesterase family protein [Deltaproteobacteria bacterium]
MDAIQTGLTGEKISSVTVELTAKHIGSGRVDVYATPAMIALMEAAAVAAIDHLLPEGKTTVGTKLDVRHLAATPLGEQVKAHAEVTAVEGRKVTFRLRAWDEHEMIGEGTHERFVIDEDRFIARMRTKVNLVTA